MFNENFKKTLPYISPNTQNIQIGRFKEAGTYQKNKGMLKSKQKKLFLYETYYYKFPGI